MKTLNEFQFIKTDAPHIAEKLELFWGTEYFIDYTTNLMLDTRDGKRKGFPFELAKAINSLIKLHDEQFPRKFKKDDIWEYENRY